jgi:hypothetical protein
MKNCTDCKYANWLKRKDGSLHPCGDGACHYPYAVPALPQALYWIGGAPRPSGGRINRREALKDHCAYFAR